MPKLGDISSGKAIGHTDGKYIWAACEICGKERWVQLKVGIPTRKRCMACKGLGLKASNVAKLKRRGIGNGMWKGGRIKDNGYIAVKIYPEDPFYLMAAKRNRHGYILEHRLVMAKHLGRCLLATEQVHHKDGNRANNELSNLELISPANHALRNSLCANCELRKEIRLLRWELKELRSALQEKLRI